MYEKVKFWYFILLAFLVGVGVEFLLVITTELPPFTIGGW